MRNLKQPFQDNTGTGGDIIRRDVLRGLAGFFSLAPLTTLPIKSAVHADQVKTATPEQDEIRVATRRETWRESKENGGTLVIWYDVRHHEDAISTVRNLKRLGKQNVVALAGRDDGGFVLVGNGRTSATIFTLRHARDGSFLAEAMLFADEQNISVLDVGNTLSENEHLGARLV